MKNLLLTDILSGITEEKIQECVSKMYKIKKIRIKHWKCEPIDYRTPNFTTGGLYRLRGVAEAYPNTLSWTLVLKVIQPESEEKNDPKHHNYWKREALVYQSNILEQLPDVIYVPQCYLVEERAEGTIWLWMEEIIGDHDAVWSDEEFSFIVSKLGQFNGEYLLGKALPDEPWLCREWMKSWVRSSMRYAYQPEASDLLFIEKLESVQEIWRKYVRFSEQIDAHLHALAKLPRVLAHQDLSQKNMYVETSNTKKESLTLIDWQFMSISGVGEDLGKLYGVGMSGGRIPLEKHSEYQEFLFDHYAAGLRQKGWNEDVRLARYGFCATFALRSVWEVPQLVKAVVNEVQDDQRICSNGKIHKLISITSLQMKAAEEANQLLDALSSLPS